MMPRILHVISTPSGVGGAERILAVLLREGRRHDWEQAVLNPFADPDPAKRLGARLPEVQYEALPVRRTSGVLRMRRRLRAAIHDFEPDIIHAHLFHAAVAVASIRRTHAVRLLTHHHGDVYAQRGLKMRASLDRAATRRFDAVVAVSESVGRLLTTWGCPPSRVHVIPNGWTGNPKPDARWPEVPTVACVANLRPEKGHDVLIEAFAVVRRSVPEARLVLVGDGPQRASLEELAARRDLVDAIDFVGYATDIWPYLADAHVCVLPSHSEALGMAALEAAAAGRPVVASDVGGLQEVVKDGQTGFLVAPRNPDAMAARILTLLRDDDLRARFGKAGRRFAEARTGDVMATGYFELYERYLSLDARSVTA